MKGLVYQLKGILKDKFCIMSFPLPLIVSFVLNFVGTIDLSTLSEYHFGVLQNNLSPQKVSWLERHGSVTEYKTQKDLTDAVNEPSTNLIGVEADSDGIKTMFSKSLMVGVVYIKIILIVFIAVPLLSCLLGADGFALIFCYLIPSNATFEGIMSLAEGTEQTIIKDIFILMAHCLVWFVLYLSIVKRQKRMNKISLKHYLSLL